MKKQILVVSIVVGTVIVAFVTLSQTKTTFRSPSTMKPPTVNFVFKYGVGAINELNTISQTYTKDMVIDPPVTVKMVLTDTEKVTVWNRLYLLKLAQEAEKPKGQTINADRSSCSNYYLHMWIDSTQKSVAWDNCQDQLEAGLQEFTDFIINLIESKEEYKELPTSKDGYIYNKSNG